MKKQFPLVLIAIVLVTVLLAGNKFWPSQWWATLLLAGFAGVIIGLAKRIWERRFIN